MMKTIAAAIAALLASSVAPAQDAATIPVEIAVAADKPGEPVKPVWRFFGADEPNYATMKDGRTTLATLGGLSKDKVYFRAHNLLTTGDGTPALKWGSTNIYTEDAQGNPIYSWTIVDQIFDAYRARGVKPYVELGFMPEAMTSAPAGMPYQHDFRPGSGTMKTGWTYPPKDYGKWEELIYQWVRHCIERYGRAEVASWYFQTWNEPNLLNPYWSGTQEEWFKLHDTAVRGVRRALPEARVGGPDIAGMRDTYLTDFMNHVKAANTPTDFLSFHAKGSPTFIEESGGKGHVRMGIANHLQVAEHEFRQIDADPVFRTKPIVIGESDPEGCAACQGPANAYRNGTMYSSYTAASFPRLQALATRRKLNLEGVLTWAFEFEDQPYFAGFRQLTSAGIDMPVMNIFKLFAKMDGRYVPATSDRQIALDTIMADGVRGVADIGTVATRNGDEIAILVWHYHDDDVPGPDAKVHLAVQGLSGALAKGARVTHYRVDGEHSNSYAAWLDMGSPIAPTRQQRAALLEAATLKTLADKDQMVRIANGSAEINFQLPRQGVSLLVLSAR